MKYVRQIFVFTFILTIVSLGTGYHFPVTKPNPNTNGFEGTGVFKETVFYRVYFDTLETAHKIVMSMEAIESKYETGYVIVAVRNSDEYTQLVKMRLKLEKIANPLTEKIEAIKKAMLVQEAGIPAYPCYRTVEETFATADSIATAFPGLATWTDEGNSWEKTNGLGGYDMKVLKLTNNAIPGPKPKLFLTGAIHAREYATAEIATRFAEYLVNNYGVDPDVTWILDYHEIHIMLHANPDGRKMAETGLLWRKNTNQNYCSPTSSSRGADLNRNFDFKWNCCGGSSGLECDDTYRGPLPASEPETQAIQNYIFAQYPDQRGPNDTDPAPTDTTGLYIDLHSHGRLVLWPWGWTATPSPNATPFQTLGRKFAYFNSHTPEQSYGLYSTDGTTTDFGYGDLGIAAYTFEMGTTFFQDCSYFENTLVPANMPALLYAAKVVRTPYLTPAGPDSLNLTLNFGSAPYNAVPAGTAVNLTASINDTRYNNTNGTEPVQNIAAAEYYIDTPPWVTSPTPVAYSMLPSDGNFNSSIESVQTSIDTTGWSEGRHLVFVRGRDANGNWGAFSAKFLYINNTPDSTPPTPNPMTWAVVPTATGPNSISMTATTASDPSGVEYYFECLTTGGHPSGWQTSPTYVDTGLLPQTSYTYRVKARDKSFYQNETSPSTQQSATTPALPQWTQLTYDDFESGWGNYTDGGADCELYSGSTYAHQGTKSADIQDNSGVSSSFYYTNGVNVATPGYSEIKVEFWFKAISMETGENFWVQYYDGAAWRTVANFVSGTDFVNGTYYNKVVYINKANYAFPTNMKIRFMCDASDNNDDVYIDEIRVSARL
ncbi:MAG: M14 family zinc carboxypeptidase [Candidatus Omnitrophota bacterium]